MRARWYTAYAEKHQNFECYVLNRKLHAKRVSKPSIFLTSYLLNFFLFLLAAGGKTVQPKGFCKTKVVRFFHFFFHPNVQPLVY